MIILYRGARGRGKTLTMVKDALKFYQNGYKIYSNLTSLKFGECITSDFILKLSRLTELKDCVLVIDEIEFFFDSREFNKEQNKQFSRFLQQIRKRNIHILSTCQYISLIDVRIRQQIDIMAYPTFNRYNFACNVYYFDLTKLEDDYSNTNLSPTFLTYHAKPIFELYNTLEMIE